MSANTVEVIDTAIVLIDVGKQIISNLYLAKLNLTTVSESVHKWSLDPDLLKVRNKLVKKFPNLPELENVQGNELFQQKLPEITEETKPFYLLMSDVDDFYNRCKDIIKEFSSKFTDFKVRIGHDNLKLNCKSITNFYFSLDKTQ